MLLKLKGMCVVLLAALAFVGCSEDDAASSLATNFDELEFSYEESDQQLLIRSTVPWTLECTYLTGSQWLSFDKTGGPGDEGIVSQRVTIKALRNTGVERRAELHVTGAGFDRKVTIVQEDGQVHIDGVELAFEGHRLFDIRRWRIAEQVMNGEVYGATPPGADDRYLAQTRVFNPKRDYLWPIPVGEMNTNTAMEQNPGY